MRPFAEYIEVLSLLSLTFQVNSFNISLSLLLHPGQPPGTWTWPWVGWGGVSKGTKNKHIQDGGGGERGERGGEKGKRRKGEKQEIGPQGIGLSSLLEKQQHSGSSPCLYRVDREVGLLYTSGQGWGITTHP